MVKETVICDGCKAERKEANHWFTIVPQASGGLVVNHWPLFRDADKAQHYCGQKCLIAAVEKFATKKD